MNSKYVFVREVEIIVLMIVREVDSSSYCNLECSTKLLIILSHCKL